MLWMLRIETGEEERVMDDGYTGCVLLPWESGCREGDSEVVVGPIIIWPKDGCESSLEGLDPLDELDQQNGQNAMESPTSTRLGQSLELTNVLLKLVP